MNEIKYEQILREGQRIIRIIKGDLTEEESDAIVNAANSRLQHGGGVAGAIVRKGGSVIQMESDRIGHVETGNAAVTGAGKLKAKFVIHAVGPVWGEGNEDGKLRSAVQNALKIADEKKLESISIPAISSGIFGFPKERCASVMKKAIIDYFNENPMSCLREIRLCNIDDLTVNIFIREWT
jgi:O-acetyl-ADP-ribose deacetylase (regulator of RNase III)